MSAESGSRIVFPVAPRLAAQIPDRMRRRLSYGWRVFRTGMAFGVFGLGALVIGFVLIPVFYLLPGAKGEREIRGQMIVHLGFRTFVWVMESLGLIRVSRIGTDRLRRDRPYVVIANHPTLIDAVLLLACMPQADCVAKKAVWNNTFLRWAVRGAGYIPNDEGEALIEACGKRLREGRCLLLFPEGTRSPMGQLGRFRRGAARVALKSGCDVVPVVITCDPPTLMKGQKWHQVPDRTVYITLKVEEAIVSRDYVNRYESVATGARRMTASIRALYEKNVGDARVDTAEVESTKLIVE